MAASCTSVQSEACELAPQGPGSRSNSGDCSVHAHINGLCIAIVLALLSGCDQRVDQVVIVGVEGATSLEHVRLGSSAACERAGQLRGTIGSGLIVFETSSIRGGLSAVTQDLAICSVREDAPGRPLWVGLTGGGADVLVLSCREGLKWQCQVYQPGGGGSWVDVTVDPATASRGTD